MYNAFLRLELAEIKKKEQECIEITIMKVSSLKPRSILQNVQLLELSLSMYHTNIHFG